MPMVVAVPVGVAVPVPVGVAVPVPVGVAVAMPVGVVVSVSVGMVVAVPVGMTVGGLIRHKNSLFRMAVLAHHYITTGRQLQLLSCDSLPTLFLNPKAGD